jgi:hypothetical protein
MYLLKDSLIQEKREPTGNQVHARSIKKRSMEFTMTHLLLVLPKETVSHINASYRLDPPKRTENDVFDDFGAIDMKIEYFYYHYCKAHGKITSIWREPDHCFQCHKKQLIISERVMVVRQPNNKKFAFFV